MLAFRQFLKTLTDEELKTIAGMVEYCLDREVGLGMNGGYNTANRKPTKERLKLQVLVALSKITN